MATLSRRAFVSGGTALMLTPLGAEAQQAGKVYRVGLIFTTSPVSEMAGPEPVHPSARAFVRGLRALGYVEWKNLILERRSAVRQLPPPAVQLVSGRRPARRELPTGGDRDQKRRGAFLHRQLRDVDRVVDRVDGASKVELTDDDEAASHALLKERAAERQQRSETGGVAALGRVKRAQLSRKLMGAGVRHRPAGARPRHLPVGAVLRP